MKKTLIGILAAAALAVASTAQAAAFLQINVGGTIVTCDTAGGPCAAGFTTGGAGSDTIAFAGTINGVSFTLAGINGQETTGAASLNSAEVNAFNTTGGSLAITVNFAANNFTLPPGTPVTFNATQTMNNNSTGGQTVTGNFTGWGNGANTLLFGPGNGTPSATPACPANAGLSCSSNGPVVSFARAGNFALNGIQTFTLASGARVLATASIITQAVPEPASMILLGTGLVGLARTARRRQRAR